MNNVFQSPEWEKLKLATGYAQSHRVDDVLVLQKNLPLGFSMLYSPMVGDDQRLKTKDQSFLEQIKKIARQNNSIFYRFELDILVLRPSTFDFSPFVKSFEEMQPEHTLVLDLTKSEDEILAQMKSKGRYNIKIAQKNNLVIEKSTMPGPALDDFYRLYSETGRRHKITFRRKLYFESLLEILGKSGYATLYTISQSKKPLASAIVLLSGKKAIYLYGASSDKYKNLMAPYQLHFEIIKEAKARGCTEYDFFGIAPENQPNHPWAGVTRFKKQFGGEERQIAGSYDLVLKPTAYQLFKVVEKLRRQQ